MIFKHKLILNNKMSRKINLTKLNITQRETLSRELTVTIQPTKYSRRMTYLHPFDVDEKNNIYVPFSYNTKYPRPRRQELPVMDVKFEGKLREEQEELYKECISKLNKYGSCLIAAFTGFGKCLGYDTPIMMYDGTIKKVQDIVVGDKLMGDDSTSRNVLSLCRGQEQMYKITSVKGDTFTANESHILSLKISGYEKVYNDPVSTSFFVKYFDKNTLSIKSKYYEKEDDAVKYLNMINKDNTIDISIKDYLNLSKSIKHILKCYKVPVNFEEKTITVDPYFLGCWLGKGGKGGQSLVDTNDNEIINFLENYAEILDMSLSIREEKDRINTYTIIRNDNCESNKLLDMMRNLNIINNKHIPHCYKCNTRDIRLKVLAGLIDTDGYYRKGCYFITQKKKRLADDIVFIARSLGFASYINGVKKSCVYNGEKIIGPYHSVSIYGSRLDEIPVLLETKRGEKMLQTEDCLVNDFTIEPIKETNYYGFTIDGNHRFLLEDYTVTHNTFLSIYISFKIRLKTLIVVNRVVLINQWKSSIEKFCPNARIQILTGKIKKKDSDFYIINAINIPKRSREEYKDMAFVCIDECHLILADKLSKCMTYLCPRYLLGLSATPYRNDGLNILFDLYFGKDKIERKMYRKHDVYVVRTGFKPKMEMTESGTVNWNSILESLSSNKKRNELIIQLVRHFPKKVLLIITKRVEQAHYLLDRLKEEGESVDYLTGNKQEFDSTCRILIGTIQKCGVGFDFACLDGIILAIDVESYFSQILGRAFRRKDNVPVIFDLVDDNPILQKHFKTRKAVYLEAGGKIHPYKKKLL
jgi:superfamily II DNA or RNA helicase